MVSEEDLRRAFRLSGQPAITSLPLLQRHVLRIWIIAVGVAVTTDVGLTALVDPDDIWIALLRSTIIPSVIAVPMAIRSGLVQLQAARAAAQLSTLVRLDQQTGLLHHNAFIEDARQALDEDAARVLLIGDIDRFKSINDSCGHQIGDQVILAVGDVVRELFGDGAIAGRIGGEEFAVLMRMPFADPGAAHHAALAFAQEWRRRIEKLRLPGVPFTISISIGLARHSVGERLDSLYARADRALYVAKTSGRNRVCADEHDEETGDGLWTDEAPGEIIWAEPDGLPPTNEAAPREPEPQPLAAPVVNPARHAATHH